MASATTPGGRHRADVGALVVRGGGLARSRRRSCGAPAAPCEIGFIAARTRSTSPVVMPPSVPPARSVLAVDARRRASTSSSWAADPRRRGGAEAVADLDALDRLDAHERRGEAGVDAAVPVHVGAEPGRQPVHDDLDDAAEGVAGAVRVVDLGDHRGARRRDPRSAPGRASIRSTSAAGGTAASSGTRTGPIATTWLTHRRCRARRGRRGRPRRARRGRRSRGRSPARAPGAPRRSRTSACRSGRRGPGAGGSAARRGRGRRRSAARPPRS